MDKEYHLKQNSAFCMLPWKHMHAWPDGRALPCCIADSDQSFGNLKTDNNGNCKISLKTDKFNVDEILGRSIIIHEDEDDLGLGEFKDSKTTGHSGSRIACSLIGISKDCK